MTESLLIAKSAGLPVNLLSGMANRHGLITGVTGTGKIVTLQKRAEIAVDDGILGGLKDILFGSTGPRGGKRDGIVQSVAKSAPRQVTSQIIRGVLGSIMGGRKR